MKNETSLKTDMKTSVMGTEALFENYTIEEIQEIEKKTKMEIEKKKEELRLMVGERYRDLIEAADTIQAMKSSAVCITKCINDIVSQCKSLPDKKSLNFQPKESAVEKHVLYEIGAQIKLLLDIPKEIWSYIDRQNYLAATQLYLLARHIHTSLTMLPSTSISVLKSFPIINRQWSTISHFRSSILQGCHEVLKEASLDEQKMADNLISLMLLEDTTPRQVFNQFLLSRTKAMQDIFSADKEGVGAKTQICDVIKLILDTVYLVHALFYKSNDADDVIVNNLLFQTFEKISSNKSNGPLSLILLDSPAMKYLPRTVIDFRPVSMSAMVHVTDDHIETNCHDWIDTVISDVSKGFTRLLGYVNSVSGLSSIRNSVWSLLADDNHKNIWDVICQRILKRSLNLWEEFMHFAFTARVKALIKSHLNCAFDNVIEALNGSIHNITDSELTKFIWSDSSMDIISKGGWLNCGDKELADSGQLAMKARCYMPKIQRLCKVFDVRIKSCLDDFGHFVIAEKDFQAPNHLHQTKEPFDRFADNAMLYQFLQDETKVCIARLFTFIHEHLKVFNEDPSSDEIMHRYVLFGRFLSGLTELSPNLSTCLCYAHHVNHAKIKSRAFSRSDIKERQAWNEIKNKLKKESYETFNLWGVATIASLLKEFKSSSEVKNGFTISHQPQWCEIEIQEENEDGAAIKSKIKVPSQISRNLMSVLGKLCSLLCDVGGHVLSRSLIGRFVKDLYFGIVRIYDERVDSLTQRTALQMMFDLKFLAMILLPKDEKNSKGQDLLQRVENIIDPFDLDVFIPHIQVNLKRSVQSSMVLLGLIIPPEKVSMYSGTRLSSTYDQPNVLPLTTGHSTFTLLPISSAFSSRASSLDPVPVKVPGRDERTRSASPSPTHNRKTRPTIQSMGMGHKSQSFYDRMTAMSSSWFGGQ